MSSATLSGATLDRETFAKRGFWGVGGPMDRFVLVETAEQLRAEILEARSADRPLFVLGNGSNLLVPDDGLRGTTLRLGGGLKTSEILPGGADRVELHVGAGMLNFALLKRHSTLSGLGPLAGVPGTMGGAIAMNAGTTLGEIGGVVDRIEGFDSDGTFQILARGDLPMAYREGGLPRGFVVTAAVLRLSRLNAESDQQRIAEHLARRKATQPWELQSCGSVFRNPLGDSAGRLIEAAGLKGWRQGDAQISEKHANFIVNQGAAKATDVLACIRKAMIEVHSQFNVVLSPEVHIVGDWPEFLWPIRVGTE